MLSKEGVGVVSCLFGAEAEVKAAWCSVCVSAPTLPVPLPPPGVTPCPGLQHPRAPQLQRDYSLSNTFAGTASARSVSQE